MRRSRVVVYFLFPFFLSSSCLFIIFIFNATKNEVNVGEEKLIKVLNLSMVMFFSFLLLVVLGNTYELE